MRKTSKNIGIARCDIKAYDFLKYLDTQSHILEPIANHDPDQWKRILNELKRTDYTCEISQYILEKDMAGRLAVGEMLHRAIMYLINKSEGE